MLLAGFPGFYRRANIEVLCFHGTGEIRSASSKLRFRLVYYLLNVFGSVHFGLPQFCRWFALKPGIHLFRFQFSGCRQMNGKSVIHFILTGAHSVVHRNWYPSPGMLSILRCSHHSSDPVSMQGVAEKK